MEGEENAQSLAAGEQERRDDPRLAVDEEASLLLPSQGANLACRIAEISLTGCRMLTRDRFLAETGVRVEASFKLRGIAFRFSAVIEWTDGKRLAGIRFIDVTARRMDELVEVLCELAAESAAKAVMQAAERRAAEEIAQKKAPGTQISKPPPLPVDAPASVPVIRPAAPQKLPELATRKPVPMAARPEVSGTGPLGPVTSRPPPSVLPGNQLIKPVGSDRRSQSRHDVDTTATILLVNVASRIQGRILNLSMGGCRIRTEERFPVGIYTRVEAEFHLEGIPFRLGGVVQAIQDRQFVGVRFLDMSVRKREQVEQLIAEIEELHQSRKLAKSEDSGAQALEA
jgi:c-di-GMP-binding flagellar brake protein YcgR